MAWVRIHDGALSHPKVVGIFDPRRPFDLWLWGLSYSQAHLTNGWLPSEAVPKGVGKASAVLIARGLWESRQQGFQIHDYLDWNDSKDSITTKRTQAKERMANARSRSSQEVRANTTKEQFANAPPRTSHEVLRGVGKSTSSLEEEKIALRAGQFVERYGELYAVHRHGARHRARPNLDWTEACDLCRLWDDARLERLAQIVLTTDDPWISGTDRSFKIFAMKASWADDRLRQAEAVSA